MKALDQSFNALDRQRVESALTTMAVLSPSRAIVGILGVALSGIDGPVHPTLPALNVAEWQPLKATRTPRKAGLPIFSTFNQSWSRTRTCGATDAANECVTIVSALVFDKGRDGFPLRAFVAAFQPASQPGRVLFDGKSSLGRRPTAASFLRYTHFSVCLRSI